MREASAPATKTAVIERRYRGPPVHGASAGSGRLLLRGWCAVPLFALALVFLLPIAFVLATPLMIVQRFRMGTARRPGRGWVTALNLFAVLLSVGVFVFAAAVTSFWVPQAFGFSLIGLATGAVLGLVGLALTRWEHTPGALHYTPNRWLVLLITAAIAARLLYGLVRAWHAWRTDTGDTSWLVESGLAGSMGVGAAVLGYYLMYSAGLWWRVRRHRRQPTRWSIREVS